MPDESKANLRYGTFCIFCCYDIQKQHILNSLHKQKLINPPPLANKTKVNKSTAIFNQPPLNFKSLL